MHSEQPTDNGSPVTDQPAASPRQASDLDTLYASERATLYRGLVLATGNRDLAVDAIDRGFSRWSSRPRRRRARAPAAQVFHLATRWSKRQRRRAAGQVQGFRLGADTPRSHPALSDAFANLSMPDRVALVVAGHFGWTGPEAGAALGVSVAEAKRRVESAMLHLNSAVSHTVDADELRSALEEQAWSVSEPLTRVDTVRFHSRLRRVGLVVGSFAATIAVVGGAAAGISALRSDAQPGEGGVDASPASDSAGAGPLGGRLVWTQVPMLIGSGEVQTVAYGAAGFVALGQDFSGPGRSIALRSADGFEWEAAPGPLGDNEGWINSVTSVGDQYVALGSRFDQRRGNEFPLLAVSDDGLTWRLIDIPVPNQVEVEGVVAETYTYFQTVAPTGTGGFIVFGNQQVEIDPEALVRDALPEGVTLDCYGTSNIGIEIYDCRGEGPEAPIQTFTWEELGVDPEVAALLFGGRAIALQTEDLETWEEVSIGGFGPEASVASIASTPSGMAALVYGRFGGQLWVSTSGVQWDRAVVPRGFTVSGVTTMADVLMAFGADATGGAFLTSSDGGATWTLAEIDAELGGLQSLTTSEYGIVALGQSSNPQVAGPAEVTKDGLLISIEANGRFTVSGADGEVIAEVYGEDLLYEGLDVTIVDPATEEPVVTLTQVEIDQAWQSIWRNVRFDDQGPPEMVMLTSRDGTEWSTYSLTEVAGPGFYPTAVAIGPQSIVLVGFDEGAEGIRGVLGGEPALTVWVATAEA